jgi:hypothetical protein
MKIDKEAAVWLVPVQFHVDLLAAVSRGEISRKTARMLLDEKWEQGLRLCREHGVEFV